MRKNWISGASAALLLVAIMASCGAVEIPSSTKVWAWRCTGLPDEAECLKERADASEAAAGQMSLYTCKLICGKYGSLMPRPNVAVIGKQTKSFLPTSISNVNVQCQGKPSICPLLDEAVQIMTETVNKYHPKYSDTFSYWFGPWPVAVQNHKLIIEFTVQRQVEYLTLGTDESYNLMITSTDLETKAVITANTFFGARHALETLSQLIDYDDENNSLQVVDTVSIEDSPAFPYRGIILDTSRNFISVDGIKRTLDAMSYNKLNSFHWHITDTHSFPLIINSLPNMANYGAYSPAQVYSPSDVRDIVQYARIRGIRVVPEIDAPAHTGHGWEWAEELGLGKLVVCLNKKPWTSYCLEPPCGQMNLANEKLYDVLGTIYNEVVDMFSPLELFHYGGDEVNLNCWNTSTEITDWMTLNGYGLDKTAYYQQWSVFQEKSRNLITVANKGQEVGGIIWTSKLTEKGHVNLYLDNRKYIIQIWTNGTDLLIKELLEKGYQVIFSNYDALYLDCGVSSWYEKGENWCSPYKGWQDVYDNDIHAIASNLTGSTNHFNQILGGEAALWTEQADGSSLDLKLWPRGAALGERLWTNPATDYKLAEYRILQHRNRMVTRGIQAARLEPEWCRQNQGQCKHVPPLPPNQ